MSRFENVPAERSPRRRRCRSVLLPALAGACALLVPCSPLCQEQPASTGEPVASCSPPCRPGFDCVQGECRSPCNPPCPYGEICTRNGVCIPSSRDGSRDKPPPARVGSGGSLIMDLETAGYAPAETDDAETEVAEDDPCFAILTNPLTIILTPLIYDGYWEIPLYVEWALRYLGVDIEGRVVVVDGEVGAIGLAGFRIQPFGSGLEHVYIVPRVGGGSYVGFAASLNWGYEYFFEHFVLGVGGSIVYATGYEEIPVMGYFNILLGVGG